MAEQQDFDTTLSAGAIRYATARLQLTRYAWESADLRVLLVCRAMYDGGDDDPIAIEPTLQVLSVKKVNPTGNSTVDRYR